MKTDRTEYFKKYYAANRERHKKMVTEAQRKNWKGKRIQNEKYRDKINPNRKRIALYRNP